MFSVLILKWWNVQMQVQQGGSSTQIWCWASVFHMQAGAPWRPLLINPWLWKKNCPAKYVMLEQACIFCSQPLLVFKQFVFTVAIFWEANPLHFWILKIIKNFGFRECNLFCLSLLVAGFFLILELLQGSVFYLFMTVSS